MRIAGFFIKTLIILVLLTAAVYFLGGQLWMAVNLRGFIEEIKDLETSKLSTASYAKRCQNAPAASSLSVPLAVQLRFLDASTYQIELRCSLIEETPVVLKSDSLPFLITKAPGASGMYLDLYAPTRSTITLKALAATKDFTVDTATVFGDGLVSTSSYPATSCTGWGYKCCNADEEKGMGVAQTSGVTDCSANCFAACSPLPYIQAFSSDPYPVSNNTVRMESEQVTVTFSYTATLLGGTVSQVHIDYGDGSSDDSSQASGSFVHSYSCPGPCENQAVISARDALGNSSVVNDSSKIYIRRE